MNFFSPWAGIFSSNERLGTMNNYFNAADWLVILLYLGGIILLGVWFGKDGPADDAGLFFG